MIRSSIVIVISMNTDPKLIWWITRHLWRKHGSKRTYKRFRRIKILSHAFKSTLTNFMYNYWWNCKECEYEFKDRRKLKKHIWREHVWKRISTGSTGFKFFKCLFYFYRFYIWTEEGLFDEVTGSEVADNAVTVWEETDCEETVRKGIVDWTVCWTVCIVEKKLCI